MAKKKGSKKGASKATKATTTAKKSNAVVATGKGRSPRKGGLHDKMAWVDAQFCSKGKTRPEAVQGLLKKYPEMSENYARTIVYSQMNEYTFVPARERKAASKKKAAPASASKKTTSESNSKDKAASKKSKSSKKSTKSAPADDDDFDDF